MEASWDYAVVLDFWTFQDCSSEAIGRNFLGTLNRFGFVPKKFGDEDPPTHEFDRASSERLLKLEAPKATELSKTRQVGVSSPSPPVWTYTELDHICSA